MVNKNSKLHLQVWERQPSDTPKGFQAFCTYRDMDPQERTVEKVATMYGKSAQNYYKFSRKYKWVDRAAAYDAFVAEKNSREKQVTDERKRISMLERHVNVATTVQNAIVGSFQNLSAEDWLKVPVDKRADILLKMASFERLSRGLPTDSVEIRTPQQMREQQITEAVLYLDEVRHEFPDVGLYWHVQVVCEEFEVGPEDLGFDDDAVERMKRDALMPEYAAGDETDIIEVEQEAG